VRELENVRRRIENRPAVVKFLDPPDNMRVGPFHVNRALRRAGAVFKATRYVLTKHDRARLEAEGERLERRAVARQKRRRP